MGNQTRISYIISVSTKNTLLSSCLRKYDTGITFQVYKQLQTMVNNVVIFMCQHYHLYSTSAEYIGKGKGIFFIE